MTAGGAESDTRERIYIYDTTLRDGAQSVGVQFREMEKRQLAITMDAFGMDYIEGGIPGANDTDATFFSALPTTRQSVISAFGMTRRAGHSAANDINLANLLNAQVRCLCLVGKAHDFHVREALGITLEENLDCITDSVAYLQGRDREVVFDAEHFFDGYRGNPEYAIRCVQAAYEAGARWIVLCDTNGGTLPKEIERITRDVIGSGIPGSFLGIHTHNDTENAVAGSLAAVDAGVRHIQGTVNGIGERCGNANLLSIIATLILKEPYRSRYRTAITEESLGKLTMLSRTLDNILNRDPDPHAAYVGSSAFAHKGGLHGSAMLRNTATYEHIAPERVGNDSRITVSNQSGKSNIRSWLKRFGFGDDELTSDIQSRIVDEVKTRESHGYAYDAALASFELLVARLRGTLPEYFRVQRFRVFVEQESQRAHGMITNSEAVVVVHIGDVRKISASEGLEDGRDSGPVHALSQAIRKDLGPYQTYIDEIELVDFKVRISGTGTAAVTRVIIESKDAAGTHWTTVGVSANLIEASFEALIDSIIWKLYRAGATPVSISG
ncbi:MAG: citramalate synthase [Rhodobacteraceae bacterium]|nr:citramalate synthase [Paracoccaceae bacterium]